MGSCMSKIYDDMEEEEWRRKRALEEKERNEKKQWLEKLSNEIKELDPDSDKFKDFKWIMDNQEKILGNKKVIKLLR